MNLKELQEKIDYYDSEINNAEKKNANLEGKKESLLQTLKNEFDIITFCSFFS